MAFRMAARSGAAVLVGCGLSTCAASPAPAPAYSAVCVLGPLPTDASPNKVSGTVTFVQPKAGNKVKVIVKLKGLAPGPQ